MPGIGLGLGIGIGSSKRRGSGGGTPTPTPVSKIIIEGDSITWYAGASERYGSLYSAHRPDLTVTVNADNSRTVGGPAWTGPPPEGADTGSPGDHAITDNTLLLQRPADLATGAQLLTALIGTNDLQTFSIANYRSRLATWAGPLRSAGTKIAYSPPPSLSSGQQYAGYTAFMAKRATLMTDARDPTVWGLFADYYLPMGEQPDLNAADNAVYFSGDGVHPVDAGHVKLYSAFRPAVDTLADATRTSSTTMINGAWLGSETNLNPGDTITRRFVVEGIAHAGLALSGGNALSVSGAAGSPGLSINGSSFTTSKTGWLYNGDTIDLKLTLSGSNSTPRSFSLTVGSETRSISYTTVAAVTPATYAHENIQNVQPTSSVHTITGATFTNTGMAVLFVHSGGTPTGISVGGVAATQRALAFSWSIWTVPITATGARNIVITHSGSVGQSTTSWGVVKDADPTPLQSDSGYVASEGDPHSTVAQTVPASGIAIDAFYEYGGATITPATVTGTGNTLVAEGSGTFQSETLGLSISKRTTSGVGSWNFGFGNFGRASIVFKAAGT